MHLQPKRRKALSHLSAYPWASALLLATALMGPAAAQSPTAAAPPPAAGSAGQPCGAAGEGGAPRDRALDYLGEIRRSLGPPGLSAAVAVGGQLVFSEAVGFADLEHLAPATPLTVYNVGSISKAMAAVAVMQLVERQLVRLEDPIQRFVPSFPVKRRPITVRHLLTHTSGIRHYRSDDFPGDPVHNLNRRPYASLEEALEIFQEDPLLFEPGEYYSYTSYGTNLLQGIVESASGMGFEAYLRQHVWAPAEMLLSSLDRPHRIVFNRARGYRVRDGEIRHHPWEDVTYKFAGGGMISTAEDLTRFGMALLDGRLVRPETLRQMFDPALTEIRQFRSDGPARPLRWRQGLIWRTRTDEGGRDYVNHCGSVKGFNSCLLIWEDEGLIVATADNADTLGLQPARKLAEIFRAPCPAGE